LINFAGPADIRKGAPLNPNKLAPTARAPQVKNPSMQLSQRLRSLSARVRLIISGTPIQNNLSEMWALFDFAVPGLLGPLRAFKLEFEKPILLVRP
jgi:SNF2 family DNA or RNA helicase